MAKYTAASYTAQQNPAHSHLFLSPYPPGLPQNKNLWTLENQFTRRARKNKSHTQTLFSLSLRPFLPARLLASPGVQKITKNPLGPKSAFAVRPECAWVINGVEDSGSGKRTGGTRIVSSSATVLEGTAMRQLRR